MQIADQNCRIDEAVRNELIAAPRRSERPFSLIPIQVLESLDFAGSGMSVVHGFQDAVWQFLEPQRR